MIRKNLNNVDSLIKKYFRKKRSLLVMILVGQALLIGLLTFICLTRDGSDNSNQVCKASQSTILVCGFFKNLLKIKYHVMGFLCRILGSSEDGEKQAVKILSPPNLAGDDDETVTVMKIIQAVLLLILMGLLAILVILTLVLTMNDDIMAQIEEEMAPFVGNNTSFLTDLSKATAQMMFTHYDIQDRNILHATWLSLMEPEKYSMANDTLAEDTKNALKYLQSVASLFPVLNETRPFQGTCLSCLDGFQGSMNEMAKCVLQALILMSVVILSRKKPEDLEMEIPEGYASIHNLGQEEFEKRIIFLTIISQLLYNKSDTIPLEDKEKIKRMHKDCIKIVTETSANLAKLNEDNPNFIKF